MIPNCTPRLRQPPILLGLLSLPVLWWLLRLVPPRPRRIDFPPTRMLFDIAPKEETPARTPWWLTLLRLTLAALVIIAAAGPLWNPPIATSHSSAPLLIMMDDGWGAAASWDARIRTAEDLIGRADADGRGVAILPMSNTSRDISLETAGAAKARLRLIKPKPHTVERTEALASLDRFLSGTGDVELVWLSDGVDAGRAGEFIGALTRLADKRTVTVVDGGIRPAHALAAADNAAGVLTVKVLRPTTGGDDTGTVRALDLKGLPLGEAGYAFKSGGHAGRCGARSSRRDPQRHRPPGDRRRAFGQRRQLLDKRWRRRHRRRHHRLDRRHRAAPAPSTFYLSRALGPFADIRLAERGSPGGR
jgi:hypothetical protein